MKKFIENNITHSPLFQTTDELKQLTFIQQRFSELFTFENLDLLLKNDQPIDQQFLIEKLFKQQRGGLCYELNGALYMLLQELGFDVTLSAATVWSEADKDWIIDRTHTIILFYKDNQLYLLDSGSGTNLYIQPLPLDGEPVQSPVGIFRLRTKETERGSIVSEKLTENGWVTRYTFHPVAVDFPEDLNRIKDMIHTHPDSPFNKELLIAGTLKDGTVSINEKRCSRKWVNERGFVDRDERVEFRTDNEMLQLVEKYSSPATLEATKKYIKKGL